jgi:predicted TIM-barrel fold metal-dependent hydrolase
MQLALERAQQSDLYKILRGLEEALPELGEPVASAIVVNRADLFDWAKKLVAFALRKFEKAVLVRDEIDSYVEFICNMLRSEARIVETLLRAYGDDKLNLQFVHYMMDMQMGYVCGETTPEEMVEPHYPFPQQLERMQDLARQFHPKVLGFSAFDPRRDTWRELALRAREMEFVGFKFYPAMGYKPIGNDNARVEKNVHDFFAYCVGEDIPVFTHCTPVGFQNRHREGRNADPLNWEKLLLSEGGKFAGLRLCFGHAGGGAFTRGEEKFPGWMASEEEWDCKNNYAATVARLCRTYDNVFCEIALIHDLLRSPSSHPETARKRFVANLRRELATPASKQRNQFENKIAYGSDWHMRGMINQPRAYLDLFLQIIDELGGAKLSEKFFWKNAYSFMKVHPS